MEIHIAKELLTKFYQLVLLVFGLVISTTSVLSEELDGESYILNCSECHGFDGNSQNKAVPNLAGLNQNYILKQLMDFKKGTRKSEDMTEVVEAIPSSDVMQALARYFSQQKMVSLNNSNEFSQNKLVDLELGKAIFEGKRMEYGIPACKACHGQKGMGAKEGRYPRLKGQHREYIVTQMQLFQTKKRRNDNPSMMRNITMIMDKEDIASVAAYIATIK